MSQIEQPTDVQSPAQRAGILAALACLVCSTLLVWVARPAVELLPVWWMELLVYVLVPIALTFTLLYASSIHREMRRLARTAFLFLVSCLIFGGVTFFMAAVIFFVMVFTGLGRGEAGH
jgi:hypothetical protein